MPFKFLEKRIIRKIQKGHSEAFGQIYDQYIDKVYKFIYFKVRTPEEAEDLVSQVFTKVLEYILKGQGIESIQALIYQVSRNKIVDYYRQKPDQISLDEAWHLPERVDFKKDIYDKIDSQADISRVEQAMRRLKGEAKEAIILRYINEYSIREVAQILGKSEGAVRVMIHRAVKDIRKEIEKLGN